MLVHNGRRLFCMLFQNRKALTPPGCWLQWVQECWLQ